MSVSCRTAAVLVAAGLLLGGSVEASTIATRIEKDTVTVLAAGQDPTAQFALVFSRQAGSIVGWYDLDRDAKMTVNLCSRGGTNAYALFQNRAEMIVEGKEVTLFPGKAEEFRVLESNEIRAVVFIRGRFTTPSGLFPGEAMKRGVLEITGRQRKTPERPEYQTRFTVYPTGRIYIRHLWEVGHMQLKTRTVLLRRGRHEKREVRRRVGTPILLSSNRMSLGTAPERDVVVLNDYAGERRAFFEPASFLLHHGTRDGFQASALLVANYRKYRTDWLGQMMTLDSGRRGWLRSAFALQDGRAIMRPGKYVWHFMLQIEPANIESREAAREYARDYLHPARISFAPGMGVLELADPEDEQMDGFAEGRGCYVVNAAGVQCVKMRIDAGTLSRYSPAFEIRRWRHEVPKFITVDGFRRHVGEHYNVHLDKGKLMLQYLGVLTPGVHTIEIDGLDTDERKIESPVFFR